MIDLLNQQLADILAETRNPKEKTMNMTLAIMIVVTAVLILCGASWHDEEAD